MNIPIESFAVYLLGFIGLAATGLVPYRSWLLIIELIKSEGRRRRRRSVLVVAAVISAGALWSDIQIGARVFTCLTEAYCGPGVASGWGYLAMLGVVYLAFEALSYLLRKAARGSGVCLQSRIFR
ncbi:hypothetical protein H5407_17320 [Mitsuaria sp. WAJ17]|uniref:hypothetical protein n=1 Tax=Mitsuaria sp. WAJ17 TaxID=2761452 RepID=UPI0016045FCF|nr:hypothetical protein [Mitsuaria sp. WAJ17]MBB2486992.1 hypothetical protein [Mitsuaria sp. WAJ17]